MRSYTKTVFVAYDGRTFDTEDACLRHEQIFPIVDWLSRDEDIMQLPLSDLQAIVESLLRKYDITERKEP